MNGSVSWRYAGVSQTVKSSLMILGGSFRSNRTYQWMVQMENKRNNSLQGTGYLLVRLEDTFPQLIAVGYKRKSLHLLFVQETNLRFRCVISTLCVPNQEYQWINPTTQVALFALCLGNCSTSEKNITWNIYQGSNNASQNITHWTLFRPANLSIFGRSLH